MLSALFSGSAAALAMSLCGGFLALFSMSAAKRLFPSVFLTLFGVSICGASAHNIGQLIAAGIILNSTGVWAYLPVLLISGVLTGSLDRGCLSFRLQLARRVGRPP
jgi:heptaprenyl diphosphate synthase